MTWKEFNEKYGRQVLVLASLMIWAYIIWSFFVNGYINTWNQWKIPAVLPPFLDFRLIPSGAETFRSGIDPAVSNPNDPGNHIFNYPKIWYIFFYTGITQEDTVWLSILLIVLFFLTTFSFAEKLSIADVFLTIPIVFSPAAMLLYERGNVDLAFFVLCGLSILLLMRFPASTVFFVTLAAMFKFFPFFGIGIFLQENKKKFYKYFFVTLVIFLIYVILNLDSLRAAWNLTLRENVNSYGSNIIFDLLKDNIRYRLFQVIPRKHVYSVFKWLPYFTTVIFLLMAFFIGAQSKESLKTDSERNLTAFRMGALIYIGTFLLGNNWDYRLAFLIFTIPQLSRWIFILKGKQKWFVIGVFISLLCSCWSTFLNHLILDEAMNWLLFGGLVYLFIASAPEWFRTFKWFHYQNGQEKSNR